MLATANNCTSFWMQMSPSLIVCSLSTENACKQMSHYLTPSVGHVHSLHFNFCLKLAYECGGKELEWNYILCDWKEGLCPKRISTQRCCRWGCAASRLSALGGSQPCSINLERLLGLLTQGGVTRHLSPKSSFIHLGGG